jgi:tetratricopeptide (TPR) repeat protein
MNPWIAILIFSFGAPALSAPADSSEATELWTEGQQDYQNGKFDSAVFELARLIEHYPSAPGFTEAHRLLGLSYLARHQAGKAIEPLQYYVQAAGKSPDGTRARAELAQAYLESHHFSEALEESRELLARADSEGQHSPLHAKARLIEAESWMGLNQDDKAAEALAISKKSLSSEADPLWSWARLVELQLKTRFCGRFPPPGELDEAQVRDQLSRRGDCLLESQLIFRELLRLKPGEEKRSLEGLDNLTSAYEAYHKACANPPRPPGKRSALELKRYRTELVDVLVPMCAEKLQKAGSMMKGWDHGLPKDSAAIEKRLQDKVTELGRRSS